MAQPIGLTLLGQALSQGTGRMAARSMQMQDEERARQQQLADRMQQREWHVGDRNLGRQWQVDDRNTDRAQRREDLTIEVLVKAGYLSPNETRNPEAINAAAMQYEADQSQNLDRSRKLPEKLQSEADLLGQQDAALAQAEATLQAKLNMPEPPPPTQAEVMNRALQMIGKPKPTSKELEEAAPAAAASIQQERLGQWFRDQQEAKVEIPLLRSQRASIRQSLQFMYQQGVTPNRPPPAEALANPSTPRMPQGGTPPTKSFKEMLDAELGNRGINTARDPAPAQNIETAIPVASPTDLPMLQSALQRQKTRQWTEEASIPYNDIRDRLQATEERISRLRAPAQFQSVGFGAPTAINPDFQAQEMSKALVELEALRREEEKGRRKLFGVGENAPLAPLRRPTAIFGNP